MSYVVPICAVTVLLIAGVSGIACWATPTIPSPSWVHVGEIGALRGGLPTPINAITVNTSGRIQVSRETDQDMILELGELRGDSTALFQELGRRAIPTSAKDQEGRSTVVQEFLPPRLRLAMGGPKGTSALWEGRLDEAPPEVIRAAALVREFAEKGVAVNTPAYGVFVRAGLLPARIAREFRGEGLVREVKPGSLNPYLTAALEQPFLLFPVKEGDNPFAPFWDRFVPRRGALELSFDDVVYQVRSLVYAAPTP